MKVNEKQSVNQEADSRSTVGDEAHVELGADLPNVGSFTPAPWKVRAATFCDDGVPSYEVVMQGKPQMNAVDARLIGKAPELYSALERTLTHLKASMAGQAHACADEAIAEAERALDLRYKPDTELSEASSSPDASTASSQISNGHRRSSVPPLKQEWK